MKTQWWMAACAAALLILTGSAAAAQGRGRGHREQDDRNRENHSRFDDHDQQVTHNWYQQHRNNAPAGFRDRDRLSSDEESRLQVGYPVDSRLREHRVPHDLSRQLAPPPRNSRYVAIGGHVAQVDHQNRVQDVIHLEANF